MVLNFRVLPQAMLDIADAIEWLEAEAGTKTRDRFIKDYVATRNKACKFPKLYAPFYKDLRKFRFSKFSYKLIYRIEDDTILIVAVAHDARSDYWKD
ncbi:MAG: type II toxin-antitoxin system RelE/ParE family toxin [Bacteroidota bacterium]